MNPYLQDADLTIYQGDALEVLRKLPDESVDCCVTSPPYWGLRDYGIDGQLGLEETPELYVERMVEVFREVRRVLAKHGTCWVNLGDSYTSGLFTRQGKPRNVPQAPNDWAGTELGDRGRAGKVKLVERSDLPGLKPKDLCGIPWRVSFALQADGWYLRSDIIWAKPNPMPESVRDRPTKAHEYVFLLTKSPRYYFDQEAVRERYDTDDRRPPHGPGQKFAPNGRPASGTRAKGPDRHVTSVQGVESLQHRDGERWPNPTGRNIRTVWEIPTQPFPEAHFATYPEELVRRCILAGCPEQVCRVCGKPRERIVEVEYVKSPVHGKGSVIGRHYETGSNNFDGAGMPRLNKQTSTTGWTDCGCATGCICKGGDSCGGFGCDYHDPNKYRPGIVLDPFLGSGTTALVARKHGRHAIGIELSPDYCAMAAKRLSQLSLLTEGDAA